MAFEQSKTVNNMVVTVKADPGVFPVGAALSVEFVPVKQQEQADAAVEEVRGEDQNVAVSYTFDIKVIDPETGIEYQPAKGQNVSVSFALAEVADIILETSVYHITEDELTGELSAEAMDVTLEDEVTAVVETDGFSLYKDCPVFKFGSEESEKVGFLYAGRKIYVYKHDDGGLGLYPFEAASVPRYFGTNKIAYIKGENVDISGDWHDYVYR